VFTYYVDNKNPGRELHATERGGNLLLRDVLRVAGCYGSPADRARVPPSSCSPIPASTGMPFRGLLLAPGASGSNPDDDLQSIWRTKAGACGSRNYRTRFTVLDVPTVSRSWIDEISLDGNRVGNGTRRAGIEGRDRRGRRSAVGPPKLAKFERRECIRRPPGCS
jgi:hypothetical protein